MKNLSFISFPTWFLCILSICSTSYSQQVWIKSPSTEYINFQKELTKSSKNIRFAEFQLRRIQKIETDSLRLSACLLESGLKQQESCWQNLNFLLQQPMNEMSNLIILELIEKMQSLDFSPTKRIFLNRLKLGFENTNIAQSMLEFATESSNQMTKIDERYLQQKFQKYLPNERSIFLVNGSEKFEPGNMDSNAVYQFVILSDSFKPYVTTSTWKEFLKQDWKLISFNFAECKNNLDTDSWTSFHQVAESNPKILNCSKDLQTEASDLQKLINDNSNGSSYFKSSSNIDRNKWTAIGVFGAIAMAAILKDKKIVLGW